MVETPRGGPKAVHGGEGLISSLESYGEKTMMRVRLYRSLWGIRVGPSPASPSSPPSSATTSGGQPAFHTRSDLLLALSDLGYAGIEASLSDLGRTRQERSDFASEIRDAGLGLIVGAYSSWRDYDDDAMDDLHSPLPVQVGRLRDEVMEAVDLGAVKVNCHSGSDSWTEDEAIRFFESIEELRWSGGLGLPSDVGLSHETHRGRPLGSPWVADRLLSQLPGLRLTSDYSHWVLSCERYFGHRRHGSGIGGGGECDEGEVGVLRRVADRVDHIHARAGTTQSPQVGDVRDERESNPGGLRAFEDHWKTIRDAVASRGGAEMSVTPEYGPPPYAPPGNPAVDVWDAVEAASAHAREILESRGASMAVADSSAAHRRTNE
jgi:hypothetical protein